MRVKDLQTVAERTKRKNEAEISTRAFPLESPSKKCSEFCSLFQALGQWGRSKKAGGQRVGPGGAKRRGPFLARSGLLVARRVCF